jgi:hypothetical protein
MEIRPIDQVANADGGADSVVGQTLQMIDEIVASEILFRHRPIPVVLVPDVAMKIDLRRHDGLARQIDVRRAGRNLQLAPAADAREPAVLHDERGVLDRCVPVAGDEPRALEHGHVGLAIEPSHIRSQDQTRQDQWTQSRTRQSTHELHVLPTPTWRLRAP